MESPTVGPSIVRKSSGSLFPRYALTRDGGTLQFFGVWLGTQWLEERLYIHPVPEASLCMHSLMMCLSLGTTLGEFNSQNQN